jgi:PAS domain S-box-containing protein
MGELEKLREQVADLTAKVRELEEKEKTLQESERRHRLINELVPDRIYSFFLNENGEPEMGEPLLGEVGKVTGYSWEESRKYDDWKKIIHPDDWPRIDEAASAAMENRPVEFEVRTITKAGETAWLKAVGVPDWDEEKDKLRACYLWLKDVTAEKNAEEELKKRERSFRMISELSSDVVFEITFEPGGRGEITEILLGDIGKLGGFDHEEVRRSPEWSKVIHPGDRALFHELNDDLRKGKGRTCELRAISKEGASRWLRVKTIPDQLDEAGRPRVAYVLVKNITVEKLADDVLRKRERHFRTISEFVSDLIVEVEVSEDGSVEVTEVVLGQLGEPGGFNEGDVRSSSTWMEFIHPDDRAAVIQATKDILKGKGSDHEVRIFREDGRTIWLNVRSIPDVAGSVEGRRRGFIMLKDITNRKQADKELLRLERLRALGQMAAGVSHNLNNILTTVIGPARLLERELTDPSLRQETDYIIKSARRAKDLVKRLNEAVRGGVETDIRNVSVNKIIREAVELTRSIWKDETESKGVEIAVKTELGEVPDIRGTRSGMLDIIVNLLLNSVDAMPEGGKILIRTEPADSGLKLTVSDNGVGMNEQTLKRVFEPFFTTKAEIGTGLGLSTVFGAITRWGGMVDVASSPGKGTTFVFILPASEQSDVPAAISSPPGEIRRARILVVEDVEAIRMLLSRVLGERHEVELAENGEEAIRSFATGDYDVAVIDLGLSGIPGDRIVRLMRQSDHSLATVLISGWDLDADDPRLKQFDFRLRKPFDDLEHVLGVVGEAVILHDKRVKGENSGGEL